MSRRELSMFAGALALAFVLLASAGFAAGRASIAAGVCPCCNRTFADVARHMASQHPDFPPPDAS